MCSCLCLQKQLSASVFSIWQSSLGSTTNIHIIHFVCFNPIKLWLDVWGGRGRQPSMFGSAIGFWLCKCFFLVSIAKSCSCECWLPIWIVCLLNIMTHLRTGAVQIKSDLISVGRPVNDRRLDQELQQPDFSIAVRSVHGGNSQLEPSDKAACELWKETNDKHIKPEQWKRQGAENNPCRDRWHSPTEINWTKKKRRWMHLHHF